MMTSQSFALHPISSVQRRRSSCSTSVISDQTLRCVICLCKLCKAMTYAWLHVGDTETPRDRNNPNDMVIKASFHQARSPQPTLPRSVCRRGALKPRRRAATDETRQKTHVKELGGLHSGLLLLSAQDGPETASRGTESDTRTSSTPHVSPLMSIRTEGTQWTRAPLWPSRETAASPCVVNR